MSLFSSLQVSASGMAAQRTRAEMLVENMANAETTRTPQGGPYRRKDVVFSSDLQIFALFGGIPEGGRPRRQRSRTWCRIIGPPEMRYMPGHPDADANGYVAFPNMNPAEEMVNLINASRSYQANVAAMPR